MGEFVSTGHGVASLPWDAANTVEPNRKVEISMAPTKAKSRKQSCSQALFQYKIDRQGSRSRQFDVKLDVVYSVELAWEAKRGRRNRFKVCEKQCFQLLV